MNKKILFLILAFTLVLPIMSQRKTDLRIHFNVPEDTLYIPAQKVFNCSFTVFNNGPDSLKVTDTLAFYLTINGDTILWANNKKYLKFFHNIASGDSMFSHYGFGFDKSNTNLELDYCLSIEAINLSDSIIDPNSNNNLSCTHIFVKNKPSGIPVVTTPNHPFVYPNPASSKFTIQSKAPVLNYKLINHQGKAIELVSPVADEIDCTLLPADIYFLSVTTAFDTYCIKVMITH